MSSSRPTTTCRRRGSPTAQSSRRPSPKRSSRSTPRPRATTPASWKARQPSSSSSIVDRHSTGFGGGPSSRHRIRTFAPERPAHHPAHLRPLVRRESSEKPMHAYGAGARILDILESFGVRAVFSSPGSEWPPLWEALDERAAAGRHPVGYSSRHEELSVMQAVGYSQATGGLS